MTAIVPLAEDLFEYTRALRRDFHRHPEIGFHEFRTAGKVASELNSLGLEVTTGIGKTGVVGILEGRQPGPVLLVRFDMDALPIQEENEADYTSQTPGVMHACGHDGHTAIGLTVARLLAAKRDLLHGAIKFIFQPAEEGLGGAESMILDGVLENPHPDHSLSLHLWNNMPSGWFGITSGPVMAASDIFHITYHGKGGHGALPNLSVDPILASSYFINAVQSIVSRNISPLDSSVISVTTIHGGDAHNVIPSQVEMSGTIRTFRPEVRTTLLRRFDEIAHQAAQIMSCTADVDVQILTPAVFNDSEITRRIHSTAESLYPRAEIDTHFMTMGSEDMAYIMQEIPGSYFFVGSADPSSGKDFPHHHPRFDFDEHALSSAVAVMTGVILDILGKNES